MTNRWKRERLRETKMLTSILQVLLVVKAILEIVRAIVELVQATRKDPKE